MNCEQMKHMRYFLRIPQGHQTPQLTWCRLWTTSSSWIGRNLWPTRQPSSISRSLTTLPPSKIWWWVAASQPVGRYSVSRHPNKCRTLWGRTTNSHMWCRLRSRGVLSQILLKQRACCSRIEGLRARGLMLEIWIYSLGVPVSQILKWEIVLRCRRKT